MFNKIDKPFFKPFLSWWLTGLLLWLPRGIQEKLNQKPYVACSYTELELTLSAINNEGKTIERIHVDLPYDPSDTNRLDALTQWLERYKQVDYCLAVNENQHLKKNIRLPTAALNNLDDVLGFEISRQTPFKVDDVYTGHRIIETPTNQKDSLAVLLVVVPKQTVAKIQAAISQIPIIFNALIIDDDVSMTLPLQAHHNSMPKVGLYGMACLAILAVVGFLAFYQPIQQHQVATELIGHKLSNSHFNASEYEQLQKTKDAAQQRSQFLDLTTKNYQPRVDVLKELTRLLPSDSWLDSIDVSNNRLVMSGESASATDLVVTLTKSRLFKEVAFIRPSTKNPQSGKEKFKIKADIVPAVE